MTTPLTILDVADGVALLTVNRPEKRNALSRALRGELVQRLDELAKNDESFLGQVLSAGLAKLSTGYPQAIEAMQEVGEEENHRIIRVERAGSRSR